MRTFVIQLCAFVVFAIMLPGCATQPCSEGFSRVVKKFPSGYEQIGPCIPQHQAEALVQLGNETLSLYCTFEIR